MPVGFNSPARNLFLLGSSGAQVVTNFFKTIDQSAGSDQIYLPDEIKYNDVDQKFVLAGSASDSQVKGFGWFEKRDDAGTADFENRIEAPQAGVNTTLRAMELDSSDNLIVVGKTADIPWIAKYSNGGVIDWQATTNSADVEYTGITSDSNGQYYACGNTPTSGEAQAFVEKFDGSGNPGWGKSAFMLGRDVVLNKVAANTRGEVVAVGYLEDDIYNKGYIVKIDTNTGEVLWDRTLTPDWQGDMLNCTDVYIDSNDQIYVTVNGNFVGYLLKYTAEGNMIWQKVSNDSAASTITFDQVKSDGETEQTIVFGTYTDPNTNDVGGILSKYSKNGNLVWRRTLFSSYNNSDTFGQAGGRGICLDADPSFYYLLYFDDAIDELNGTPLGYTFGKVSSSGNGLGGFEYTEGTGETLYYDILNVQDKIGKLSDGSVRNDTSDLITYPFNANKLLFDDLATQVSNKKRQMDGPDSFEYSGSPAIRPADFQELNLLGENVSDRTWTDSSGKSNNGLASLTEPFSGAGSTSFDGTGDSISVGPLLPTSTGTAFTVDMFWRSTSNTSQTCLWEQHNSGSGRTAYFINGTNAFLISEGNTVGSFAYSDNVWYFTRVTYTAGGAIEVFVNGVSRGTGTQTVGVDNVNFVIGDRSGANESFNGYISNCRVVVGSALNGTEVPTTSLTAITGTELLTCQGDTIADASANNSTITVNGNAAPTDDGPTHNAAGYWEFDGVDDRILIDDDGRFQFADNGSDFGIETWVKRTGDNGVYTTIAASWGQSTPIDNWILSHNLGILGFVWAPHSTGNYFITGGSLTLNNWHHVIATRSGNNFKLYVDGVETASGTSSGSYTSALPYIEIGHYGNTSANSWFVGEIGEVRIYPRALTAAQVFQNYNATKSKYTNEAPDTAPKISDSAIVYDSNLLLNYDFGNRATYDRAENLSVYSEDFTLNNISTGWRTDAPQYSRATLIANTGIDSPVGTNNASRWQSGNQTNEELIYHLVPTALTIGETYTVSCWIRRVESFGNVQFYLGDNATLDVTSQVDAVPFGQWVRVNATRTITGENGTPIRNYIAVRPNGNVNGGDKTTIDIWGMNVNQGSTPGRYIKTSGTAITAPTTVKNLSSSSYTGTISGPVFDSAGYFQFGQSNTSGITNASFDYDDTTNPDFTVEAWVWGDNWSSNGNSYNSIMNRSDGNPIFSVFIASSTGDLGAEGEMASWRFDPGGGNTQHASSGSGDNALILSTGVWNHCVWVWKDGFGYIYYLNNSSNSNHATFITGRKDSTSAFTIGKWQNNSYELDGRIGEIRFYNRELTFDEVSQNFNATRSKYGV